MEDRIREALKAIEALNPSVSLQPESLFTAVLRRLESFGYKVQAADAWPLKYAAESTETTIKNDCNLPEVPEALFYIAVDRVCGSFLAEMRRSGKLAIDGIDLDRAVSQIKEGDTTVSFESGASADDLLRQMLAYLTARGDGEVLCYRRLRW